MKAIVRETHGPPDVLHPPDAPVPTLCDGDVLVRVRAASRSNRPCPDPQLQNGSRRRLRHASGGLYWEAPADGAMTSWGLDDRRK